MVLVPLVKRAVGVFQRYSELADREGIIYESRRAVFDHLSGSRCASSQQQDRRADGPGQQRRGRGAGRHHEHHPEHRLEYAGADRTLAIMLTLEWRLTCLGVIPSPLIVPARRVGSSCEGHPRGMTLNAQMNGMMNETLNVSGALLVKLFRAASRTRAAGSRSGRPASAMWASARRFIGRWFSWGSDWSAPSGRRWSSGRAAPGVSDALTIGTVVAFGAYLTQLLRGRSRR